LSWRRKGGAGVATARGRLRSYDDEHLRADPSPDRWRCDLAVRVQPRLFVIVDALRKAEEMAAAKAEIRRRRRALAR
jgi:hypothetical protein